LADTVTPPKEISLSWWKKNVPKSLPKNAKIEALLKEADGFDLGQLPKIFRQRKAELVNLEFDDIQSGKHKIIPDYGDLEAELKKFKVIVTKEKHNSFSDALDVLIKHTKSARDAAKKVADAQSIAIQSDAGQAKSIPVNTYKAKVAAAEESVLTASKLLPKLESSSTNTTDAKVIERNIGQIRYLKSQFSDISKSMKLMSADKDGVLALPGNTALETKVRTVAKAVEGLKAVVTRAEKTALLGAMRILGDKEGKALFMSAPVVKIELRKV
jgi:hypothetical protein